MCAAARAAWPHLGLSLTGAVPLWLQQAEQTACAFGCSSLKPTSADGRHVLVLSYSHTPCWWNSDLPEAAMRFMAANAGQGAARLLHSYGDENAS